MTRRTEIAGHAAVLKGETLEFKRDAHPAQGPLTIIVDFAHTAGRADHQGSILIPAFFARCRKYRCSASVDSKSVGAPGKSIRRLSSAA
jgi:hypothetical protein